MDGRCVLVISAAAIPTAQSSLAPFRCRGPLSATQLFSLVALPSTVVGYVATGVLTTATLLGVGVLLVEAASRTAAA